MMSQSVSGSDKTCVSVRMPISLKNKLLSEAVNKDRNLNQQIVHLIRKHFNK